MRLRMIVAIVLICLGVLVLVAGGTFTSRGPILTVGDLEVEAARRHALRPWVGAVAVVTGVAIALAAARRRA